jgi:pSer/pThr/pTyr-binding forkhead associated (FHA) protein
VANEENGVRVLDDRSLNGIQVNGRRVEWSPLTDGDELVIGRHAIYFMDTTAVPAAAGSSTSAE